MAFPSGHRYNKPHQDIQLYYAIRKIYLYDFIYRAIYNAAEIRTKIKFNIAALVFHRHNPHNRELFFSSRRRNRNPPN